MEEDDLSALGTAAVHLGVALALTVAEDADGLSFHGQILLGGDGVLDGQQAVEAVALDHVGDLLHLGGGSALAGGVDEGVEHIEAHGLQGRQSVLKLGLGLPGEAHDDIGCDDHVGHFLPHVADGVEVLRHIVMAIHSLQHAVVARLHGEVEAAGDVLALRHDVNELAGGILGVGGHEGKPPVPLDGIQLGHQIREVAVGALTVGIDVLTQQGDLLVARLHQLSDLGDDVLLGAAPLPASAVGHDAVGAEIVTAVHDRDPCPIARLAADGRALGYGFGEVILGLRGDEAPLLLNGVPQHLGEMVERGGAQGEGDVGVLHFQLVAAMLLGGHTAANADDEVGVLRADVLVLADDGQGLLLGVLTDGAGVDHDEIGILGGCDDLVAHLLGHARNLFAVGLVLLASEGQDKALTRPSRLGGVGLIPRTDTGGVVLALGEADGGEYILCCHGGSFAKNSLLYIIPHFFKIVKTGGRGLRKNKYFQKMSLSPFISVIVYGIMIPDKHTQGGKRHAGDIFHPPFGSL